MAWHEWPGQVKGTPGTLAHFKRWASELVFEDGKQHPPEQWQLDFMRDVLKGYEECWLVVPEGNSKSLSLDTPLPTPTGWTTMGEVQVGDYVLGSDGQPNRVTHTSQVRYDHKCYEVVFSDGATITADAGHLWTVEDAQNKYKERTLTTQELRDAGVCGKGTPAWYTAGPKRQRRTARASETPGRARRWRVRTAARQGEDAQLPVDPYVLGAWLGDGHTHEGVFTNMDEEVWDRIRSAGYATTVNDRAAESNRAQTRTIYGLKVQLRAAGCLDTKHIPEAYLLASYEQRIALMQGLIDTDGCVSKGGQVTYVSVSERLAEDVRKLAWSLGRPCYWQEIYTTHNGEDYLYYHLTIACTAEHGLAYLPRKVERLKQKSAASGYRRIVDIRPVGSVPVKCIAVDSEDKLYLAGEAMVPTHNTTFIAEICLYHLEVTQYPWVPIGAASRDQAEILFAQAKGFIDRTPGLKYMKDGPTEGDPNAMTGERGSCDGPFEVKGTRLIKHRFNGGEGLKVYAADKETADGVIPTLPVIDEGHRHRDLGLYRLWKGKCEKRQATIILISTSGEPGSDFEKSRDALRDHATVRSKRGLCFGRYETETSVLHEYAVPDRRLVEDIDVVKQANPLSKISVRSLTRKRSSPTLDYGEGWLRLTCNIPARSSSAAVNEADWDDAHLAPGVLEEAPDAVIPEGKPVIVGADFAWSLDTTALVPLWIPHKKLRLIGQARILEPPRDGRSLSPVLVRDAFLAINERNPIVGVVMDVTKAEDTMLWLEETFECEIFKRTQGNAEATEDYEAFMQSLRGGAAPDAEVSSRWLRHNDLPDYVTDGTTGEVTEVNGALRVHIMNAVARKLPGDKYRFDRPSTSRSAALQEHRVIDGLTALAMANSVGAANLDAEPAMPMVAVVGR